MRHARSLESVASPSLAEEDLDDGDVDGDVTGGLPQGRASTWASARARGALKGAGGRGRGTDSGRRIASGTLHIIVC